MPADDEAAEFIAKMKDRAGRYRRISEAAQRPLSPQGLQPFKLAFDAWEGHGEVEYGGVMVLKNFDRFRKDLTVLSGFYNATYISRRRSAGTEKACRSAQYCEEEFGRVYRAILNVIWGE